jgi:hypothetical protein
MRTLVDITFLYNLFTFLYKIPRSVSFCLFGQYFDHLFPFGKFFYLVPIGWNCVVVLIPMDISFTLLLGLNLLCLCHMFARVSFL